ncbi:hypothetical protein FE257_009914 [Aspergillus nanangensis]|uniref:Uncharacterized protein n=1 Tax=Aspergillus nanangensis TaxID=2582783 RepID=A0AAD4GXE7_ASPNN|nr:hypothetical protein FE257_009914 [Aspergillus nanangensis]
MYSLHYTYWKMLKSLSHYMSLSSTSDESKRPFITKHDDCQSLSLHEKRQKRLQWILIFQSIVTVLLGTGLLVTLFLPKPNTYYIPNELYSPAQDFVSYNTKVFHSGFGTDTTRYMGPPTEANRQAWRGLYQGGIVKIPMEQAAQLPVKTVPLPNNPGYYVVGIDVFHQLHCLNQIRLKLWGINHDHKPRTHRSTEQKQPDDEEDGRQGMEHLDHCVDSIRQSLMCSSDISVIIWQWHEPSQSVRPHANITHTCRDFEAIRNWAWSRRAPNWNQSIHVPDPLEA